MSDFLSAASKPRKGRDDRFGAPAVMQILKLKHGSPSAAITSGREKLLALSNSSKFEGDMGLNTKATLNV